jgi:SAM-dependent methyltransferase
MNSTAQLQEIYQRRFGSTAAYRQRVWSVLTKQFFPKYVSAESDVLDLGCGYGEFINQIRCRKKYALDLNPDAPQHLASDVQFIQHDCTQCWPLADASLDVVFTSNFFEHLPDKNRLSETLGQAFRCLRSGGRLIALGPNIKFLAGTYWDFFDHHIALTEKSLSEALAIEGFTIARSVDRFLPYTLVGGPEYPLFLVDLYLRLPLAWKLRGRQFLVIAQKPGVPPTAAEVG